MIFTQNVLVKCNPFGNDISDDVELATNGEKGQNKDPGTMIILKYKFCIEKTQNSLDLLLYRPTDT